MTRILIITHDYIGEKMAGPAIRSFEMATALSRDYHVVLGSLIKPTVSSELFDIRHVTENSLHPLCKKTDIIIVQPTILSMFPSLAKHCQPIVVDIYNAYMVESLEANRNLSPVERDAANNLNLVMTMDLLSKGDLFLCSNERQKDYWLGMLSCVGRVTPQLYDTDPTGAALIAIVPNGIPNNEPAHTRRVAKGNITNINPTDKLLLWGGGIFNWFDPVTVIRGAALLKEVRSDIKTLFMGAQVPSPGVPRYIWSEMRKAFALSRELGLLNQDVFFNTGWVPYIERQNYLMEADLGISLHYNNLETRFSYRTRILDYLWADLPVVTTEGDTMAELVTHLNLGRAIPVGDPEKFAAAVLTLLNEREEYQSCQANIRLAKKELSWEKAMQPLLHYCKNPWKKILQPTGRP